MQGFRTKNATRSACRKTQRLLWGHACFSLSAANQPTCMPSLSLRLSCTSTPSCSTAGRAGSLPQFQNCTTVGSPYVTSGSTKCSREWFATARIWSCCDSDSGSGHQSIAQTGAPVKNVRDCPDSTGIDWNNCKFWKLTFE